MLIRYGNSAITYTNPPGLLIAAGKLLFDQTCSSCHGSEANGVSPDGQATSAPTCRAWARPPSTSGSPPGRMPATDIEAVEAERKPPRLTDKQALEVAAYVNSLDPSVPAVPTRNLRGANVSDGADLFSLNCAACHTITGAGDALAFGTNAPVAAEQAGHGPAGGRGHADRAGQHAPVLRQPDRPPGARRGGLRHGEDPAPDQPRRCRLGGVGPVAEGFVALLIGVGGLALICFWIGERS